MARTTFPDYEVPHLWAHKAMQQADGRRSPGYPNGRVFFRGDTIYSYGNHFPMATHKEFNGKPFVLVTDRKYSNTTSKHMWSVRKAISHLESFDTWNPLTATIEHVKQLYDERSVELTDEANNLKRQSSKVKAYHHLVRHEEKRKRLYDFMGLEYPGVFIDKSSMVELCHEYEVKLQAARDKRYATIAADTRTWREKDADRRARKQEILAKKNRSAIEAWRKGSGYRLAYGLPTMLRINGDTMETSLGASVPLDHVLKALPLVLRIMNTPGKVYERNGHSIHLGHYVIDRIDNAVLRAGCHVITKEEVDHFAKLVEGQYDNHTEDGHD